MWAIKGDERDTVNLKTGLLKHVNPEQISVCKGSHLLPDYERDALGKYVDKLPVETVDEECVTPGSNS